MLKIFVAGKQIKKDQIRPFMGEKKFSEKEKGYGLLH